jgi:subtilisin family serine protease
MPAQQVLVRLVPKSRSGAPLPPTLASASPSTAKELAPAPGRAEAALGPAASLGIPATVSVRHALDGVIPVAKFAETFACELEEATLSAPKGKGAALFAAPAEKALVPKGELQVPAALADQIAFAYVPTPPQFFALQFVPPSASFYCLRLEDVARALRAYRCHRFGWTGKGIRIAMADTGFAPLPFFEDYGFDIQRAHTPATADPSTDDSGHGTGECANALVIAPDCSFFGVKHADYAAQALETCLAQKPRIVTNSWGWDIDNQSLDELRQKDPNQHNELRDVANIIADALADGVAMIFSAGNGQRPFPACLPEVIAAGGVTVGADGGLQASSYASSFVSKLYPGRRVPDFCGVVGEYNDSKPMKGHIMLPVPNGSKLEGENLPASGQNRGWGVFSGTSAAAPQIAGIAALMLSVSPTLKPADIKAILAATARDVEHGSTAMEDEAQPGVDLATGSGIVDAFAACLRVRQLLGPS